MNKHKHAEKNKVPEAQSYFGIGKFFIWIIGLVIIIFLKLCGFDIAYPAASP